MEIVGGFILALAFGYFMDYLLNPRLPTDVGRALSGRRLEGIAFQPGRVARDFKNAIHPAHLDHRTAVGGSASGG